MRAVNLLPKDTSKQKKIGQKELPVLVGGGLGVLAVGALALTMMSAKSQVDAAKQALSDKQQELAALPQPPAPPSAAQTSLASENSARVAALTAALSTRTPWDKILREFSLVLPGDVTLTGLNMATSPAPALSITGYTSSHDAVARLLVRLATIPDLGAATLSSSSRTVQDGVPQVSFSINIPLAGAAVPAAPAAAPPPPTDTSTDSTSTGSGATG